MAYKLLNLRAVKFSPVNKIHIFQCMGKIFCVEFQRIPLKFYTKYFIHTLKDMILIQHLYFKSSWILRAYTGMCFWNDPGGRLKSSFLLTDRPLENGVWPVMSLFKLSVCSSDFSGGYMLGREERLALESSLRVRMSDRLRRGAAQEPFLKTWWKYYAYHILSVRSALRYRRGHLYCDFIWQGFTSMANHHTAAIPVD